MDLKEKRNLMHKVEFHKSLVLLLRFTCPDFKLIAISVNVFPDAFGLFFGTLRDFLTFPSTFLESGNKTQFVTASSRRTIVKPAGSHYFTASGEKGSSCEQIGNEKHLHDIARAKTRVQFYLPDP